MESLSYGVFEICSSYREVTVYSKILKEIAIQSSLFLIRFHPLEVIYVKKYWGFSNLLSSVSIYF